MSPWKLVYCFSKKLSVDESKFQITLNCLKKSIELSSNYHKVKIVTDLSTMKFLTEINVEKEIYKFENFDFLDDIKIQLLPKLKKNEVLIDPDVFLFSELKIDANCDIFLERPEKITDEWYKKDYIDSLEYAFSKKLKFESKGDIVGNIGIIKIFNKELLNTYIKEYNNLKTLSKSDNKQLPKFPKFSILFGQLLLQNIIDSFEYDFKFAKNNKENKYYHLAGEQKYKIGYVDKLLNKKSII